MREAGVKLWVITDDYREKAENIGYWANLLECKKDVIHIEGHSSNEVRAQI